MPAHRLGDEHGTDGVQSDAAEVLRDVHAQQAQFAALAHQLPRDGPVLGLERVTPRDDLLLDEGLRRRGDHPMLVVAVLGREHIVRRGLAEQPRATELG